MSSRLSSDRPGCHLLASCSLHTGQSACFRLASGVLPPLACSLVRSLPRLVVHPNGPKLNSLKTLSKSPPPKTTRGRPLVCRPSRLVKWIRADHSGRPLGSVIACALIGAPRLCPVWVAREGPLVCRVVFPAVLAWPSSRARFRVGGQRQTTNERMASFGLSECLFSHRLAFAALPSGRQLEHQKQLPKYPRAIWTSWLARV